MNILNKLLALFMRLKPDNTVHDATELVWRHYTAQSICVKGGNTYVYENNAKRLAINSGNIIHGGVDFIKATRIAQEHYNEQLDKQIC